MTSSAVLLYTRPDFAKLQARILDGWYRDMPLKPIIAHSSFANLHTYINQGWEPQLAPPYTRPHTHQLIRSPTGQGP